MILGSSEKIYFVVPFLDTSALLSLFFFFYKYLKHFYMYLNLHLYIKMEENQSLKSVSSTSRGF